MAIHLDVTPRDGKLSSPKTPESSCSWTAGERMTMIASLRYLDSFAKIDGAWYFAERGLLLDWSETRPSSR